MLPEQLKFHFVMSIANLNFILCLLNCPVSKGTCLRKAVICMMLERQLHGIK